MALEERTRTREPLIQSEELGLVTTKWKYGSCTTSPPFHSTYDNISSKTVSSETASMTDVVTPEFHKLRDKGEIFNNPMTRTKVTESYPGVKQDGWALMESKGCTPLKWYDYSYLEREGTVWLADRPWINGSLFCAPPDLTDQIAGMKSRAIAQAWANIDSSEILALVSLFESEKTIAGLADTMKRLLKFLRHAKKLQLAELRKLGLTNRDRQRTLRQARRSWNAIKEEFSLASLANRYMELRYGWRPLYYDAVGATAAIKAEFSALRQTFRGSEQYSVETEGSDYFRTDLTSWVGFKLYVNQHTRVDVTVRAGVLCDVDLSQMDPWGFTKIPESMFDLTPYSFVIGWFFNLSDVIAAWTPDVGFKALASWVSVNTVTTQTATTAQCVPIIQVPATYERYSGEMDFEQDVINYKITDVYTREPDPSRPILPTWKLRMNCAKLADLAIMCKNLLYGGRNPLATRTLRV